MADDPKRRKTERGKKDRDRDRDRDRDADEQSELGVSDQTEDGGDAGERRDSGSSLEGRSNEVAASGSKGERPSPDTKTGASSGRGDVRSRHSRSARLTEAQIDTPKRQTLVLLGIVSLMTIVLWVSAKAACNMRTQITRPRKVTTEQIVRTPKHAAIELQQRWAKADFSGAQDLASAAVAAELEKEKNSCDTSCVSARRLAAERMLSTAYVVDRDENATRVWVRTVGMAQGEQNYVLEVVRDQSSKQWEIVSRRPARPGEKPVRSAPPPASAESAEPIADAGSPDASAIAADAGARAAASGNRAASGVPAPAQPASVSSSAPPSAPAPANSPEPAASASQ